MIRHIVFFTVASGSDVAPVLEGLSALTKNPHARRLEVARNAKTDPWSTEIDIVVYGEFENEAELAAFKAHEIYTECTKHVRPMRELRFAVDYEVAATR